MRIKAALIEKEESCAPGGDSKTVSLEFYMSSDGGPENKAAFLFNPQGYMKLYGLTSQAAAGFECGKAYFIDVTPAG